MKLRNIEIHVLNSLCDDYENVNSIQGDLLNVLKKRVQVKSIVEHLKKLSRLRLIDAYKYDIEKYVFIKQEDLSTIDYVTSWFFITDRGREELDENWKGPD